MITYKNWKESYAFHVDGPALKPHTLNGAAQQLRTFADNLRKTFKEDDKFKNLRSKVEQAAKLLDRAAKTVSNQIDDEDKNRSHFFHNQSKKFERPN